MNSGFFEKQGLHALLLLLLLYGAMSLVAQEDLVGESMGLSATAWFWISLAVPVAHQVYVWLSWRGELYGKWWTGCCGDRAFGRYALIFSILGISRMLSVIGLALASIDTLEMDPLIRYPASILASLLFIYLMYCVARYFGFERAMGKDHFDSSYRALPFVREGIFHYSSNAMYRFGFLGLWIPGLLAASEPALLVALFSHLYIWVHYYCTELPDIRRIYGR